jgi:predicted O-methyltransferase YrrM
MRSTGDQTELYIASLWGQESEAILMARKNALNINREGICLGASEGALLSFFVKAFNVQRMIEVGTLTGVSGLWILKGMDSHGKLVTVESNSTHADLARRAFVAAGVADQVHIIVGDAVENLAGVDKNIQFDAMFIDANKSAYLDYLIAAERLVKKGGLIIADNTLLRNSVSALSLGLEIPKDIPFSKKQIEVMLMFNQKLADPKKYTSIMIPTGEGLTVAVKNF